MIITIAHNKGGVGKSTLALNIAEGIKPDLIIDQDTHTSLAIINKLRPEGRQFHVEHSLTKSKLIEHLKRSDDGAVILIDCGGFDSDVNRIAIAAADLLIVPANDDISELIGLQSFDRVLGDIAKNTGSKINAKVLMNRTHPGRSNFTEVNRFLESASNFSRMNSIIARRKHYPDAMAKGMGVLGMVGSSYSDAGLEMKRLIAEIENELKHETP